MYGLRMGEALGLKWSDIDLEAGTLRVHRQVQRIREGGGLVFSEPKNASRRTIDLPQRAVEALKSHRKRQLEEQLRVGVNWHENGLVFASCKGTPLDAQNIVNRYTLSPCSAVADCRKYAGTTSATPVPPCYWVAACTRRWSNISWDTVAYSSLWIASLTGYPRWVVRPQRGWSRLWVSYCCSTAAKAPDVHIGTFSFFRDLQVKKRADERTRTADLLITSLLANVLGCPTASGICACLEGFP